MIQGEKRKIERRWSKEKKGGADGGDKGRKGRQGKWRAVRTGKRSGLREGREEERQRRTGRSKAGAVDPANFLGIISVSRHHIFSPSLPFSLPSFES